jgi:hypothetical protein
MTTTDTIGCREHGWSPPSACCGPRATGDGAADSSWHADTGDRTLVSTVGLITDSAGGVGFVGGEWRHGAFYYNRSVTNVSITNVTHVYNRTVVRNIDDEFNGGRGGAGPGFRARGRVRTRTAHRPSTFRGSTSARP